MKITYILGVCIVGVVLVSIFTSCATSKKSTNEGTETLSLPPPECPPAAEYPAIAMANLLFEPGNSTMPSATLYYPGGEEYADIAERPFVSAKEQPLSTFSLHPDSAAYANIRRFLEQGQWPPSDAVRIEELVNYFSYDYPQPQGKHPFSINVEVGACPWAGEHLLARIGLKGRDLPKGERPPANLVFLIDTSGSMSASNRLPLVKESLKALLEILEPEDRVALVTYAGTSNVALESTPVEQRVTIRDAIEVLGNHL